MVMCAPNCDCRWCKICEMAYHPLFKDRVDEMITEYETIVPPKPKYNYKLMNDGDENFDILVKTNLT